MDEAYLIELKNSPSFVLLFQARCYLQSAEILCHTTEYRQGFIMAPPLHLLAHGAELLLKASLILGGSTEREARSFKHDIWKLWNDDRNTLVRVDLLKVAEEEWEAAKRNPAWLDGFSEDSAVLFEEYLERLSQLHTKETDYALRYHPSSGELMPKPHWLVPIMYRVADKYICELVQQRSF